MSKPKLGFCVCGSFCTIAKAIEQMRKLADEYEIVPIVSEITAKTDTRFGKSNDIINEIEEICNRNIIKTIVAAEPIGPKNMTDIMLIAPCTGNTMAKLSNGITDTTVTMAAKSHLRNARPIVIAPSTNDALGNAAKNIGVLLNTRHYFFVPFSQDSPNGKPRSMVADFSKIPQAVAAAISLKQIEPIVF